MSKYLIEDAFKSLDEVMAENRKTLTEGLGKDDPVKQAALSVLHGYDDGKITEDDKLQIFGTDPESIDDYKKAVEEEIIDFGKCLSEESIVQDGDRYIGTYSFINLPEKEDEDLDESVDLDEKLPRDLRNAIDNTVVRRKYNSYDLNNNRKIRRQSSVDFENADYKEVTPEEAKKILKDKSKLPNFYFLFKTPTFNNKDRGIVVKYDKNGNCLTDFKYYDKAYVKSSGERVYDVKWWPLKYVIEVADKIYYTNEDENTINRDYLHTSGYNPDYYNIDDEGRSKQKFKKFATGEFAPSSYFWDIQGNFPYDSEEYKHYSVTQDTGNHYGSRRKKTNTSTWNWDVDPVHALTKLKQIQADIIKFKDEHDMDNLSDEEKSSYDTLKKSYNRVLYSYNKLNDRLDRYSDSYGTRRYSKDRDLLYAQTLHQKNLNMYKFYRDQLESVKAQVNAVKDDHYRTRYATNQYQIKRLEQDIEDYTNRIKRLHDQIQEIQKLQTPELKQEDEEYIKDKLDDIADIYYSAKAELDKLLKKEASNESLNESVDEFEGETHYRVYLLDTEGTESFNDENDHIDSDDNCIELAKQYYNQEDNKFDRVVACKININGDEQEVIELWDSQDDDLDLNECNQTKDLQEAVFKNIENARLQEAKAFNLKDDKEVIDAEAYKNIDDKQDEILVAVDPTLESTDSEYEPHVGDGLLQCRSCREIIVKPVDGIQKDEESEFYNVDMPCPHCGAKDGFKYLAQLSSPESEEAKEEIQEKDPEEPKEEEVKEDEIKDEEVIETPEDQENQEADDIIDELQEESFDRLINDHLTSLYENVKQYKTTNVTLDENKLIVEGVLTSDKDRVLNTTFTFDISNNDKNYLLEGSNNIFGTIDKAFTLNCKLENNKLICEELKDNYSKDLSTEDK